MSELKVIRIEKVTLNCGCGTDQTRLDKSSKLLQGITGCKPVRTLSNVRIAGWGLRKGLPIGTKVTVRGPDAHKLIERLLDAKDKTLMPTMIDDHGNISFGIAECIDIPGVEYTPEIGIIGLQCTITLSRPGYRIKNRARFVKKIPSRHQISKEDAISFMSEQFGMKIAVKEEDEE